MSKSHSSSYGRVPALQFSADMLRLKFKRRADEHERVERLRVVTKKPLLSPPSPRLELSQKTKKGVFEYCVHQCRLRADCGEPDSRVEKLLRGCVHDFLRAAEE